MLIQRRFSAALLFTVLGACNCDDPLLTVVDPEPDGSFLDVGGFTDVGFPDSGVDAGFPDTGVPPDSGVPEARVLTFDGTSPVAFFYRQVRDLRFVLRTPAGVPVVGEQIRFTLVGTAGAIGAASATTDATGGGIVRFTAGAMLGAGTLTASADRATSVMVTLDVREDPTAQLTVNVASTARIGVASAMSSIYVGVTPPTCAQLYAAATLPVPTLTGSYAAVPGSQSYSGLQSGSLVTTYAIGRTARGDVVARGCVEGTRLPGGVTTTVLVTLEQLPSVLVGDYDALLGVDLGQAIPPPIGDIVILLTDLLADPAGWAVYQTLVALDDSLGTDFVQWVPPSGGAERLATFAEVRANAPIFNVWRIATDALDTVLVGQLGQAYVDFTTIGGDISQAIRQFEVGTHFTVTSSGTPGRLEVEESWQAIVFEWSDGCPVGDLGCARRAIPINGGVSGLGPVEAIYGATINHAAIPGETERFQLDLDPHAMDFQYGSLVLVVLNSLVFPNLPPSIAGNNLTQVLGNIIDCANVASSLSTAIGLPPNFILAFCNGAVAAAAGAVEDQILTLDDQGNPGLVTGGNGGEIILVDADHDLRTELIPELTKSAQWSTGNPPVASPVMGYGRRSASNCGGDSDCAANEACHVIAGYLAVTAVEQDCRRAVGTGAAAVACAQNGDCRSGWCFAPGSGSRVCFGACDPTHACPTGTCTNDAALLDLDPVLAGLGDAPADACVP